MIRLETVSRCLLCGAAGRPAYAGLRDRLFGVEGAWALARCPACGLVWMDPRPTREEIGKVYRGYYTHGAGKEMPRLPGLSLVGRLLGALPAVRDAASLRVMNLTGPPGSLLDVGCGDGEFLARMRDLGWRVSGVEPDAEAAKRAWTRHGLSVHASLADVPGEFDAVTHAHVVEHVHDPVGLLRECRRLLRPGGRLVAVTPNLRSLGHFVFRGDWLGLDPPRHLTLFTRQTLVRCALAAGFADPSVRSTARWARSAWVNSGGIRRRTLAGGIVFQAVEHLLPGAGEELVLECAR